jgi:hypothetical protein
MNRLIEAAVVVAILSGAAAIYMGATYFCHRVSGPWMTGSSDPLVVTTYCSRNSGGSR